MLNLVKLDLGITTTDFDTLLTMYINDCIAEMTGLGVTNISSTEGSVTTYDPQAQGAIIAYCKWKFRNNEDKADFEAIYKSKLGILMHMTGHTNWEA